MSIAHVQSMQCVEMKEGGERRVVLETSEGPLVLSSEFAQDLKSWTEVFQYLQSLILGVVRVAWSIGSKRRTVLILF
jgi:hypothetical protein